MTILHSERTAIFRCRTDAYQASFTTKEGPATPGCGPLFPGLQAFGLRTVIEDSLRRLSSSHVVDLLDLAPTLPEYCPGRPFLGCFSRCHGSKSDLKDPRDMRD